MEAELTIVIPARNEIAMLPKLLESLCRQDYEGMAETRVLVADAGSTDGTVEAALRFQDFIAGFLRTDTTQHRSKRRTITSGVFAESLETFGGSPNGPHGLF